MSDTPVAGARCAQHVHSGERWDMRGHQCGKRATVERGGKWWCGVHDPEKVNARKAAADNARELGNVLMDARGELRDTEELVLSAIRRGEKPDRQRLLRADVKYAEAKAAADANGKVSKFYYGR